MASTQPQVQRSGRVDFPAGLRDLASTAAVKMTPKLFVVYLAWVLLVMEPDWWLSRTIGGPFYRIPFVILPILLLIVVTEQKWSRISIPFTIFILLHMWASVFAENAGYPRVPTKFLIHMFALWGATLAIIDTVPKATILLKIYVLQFFWFGIQGIPSGLVAWHPLLANEDSFGPLMGIAFGFTFYFALAADTKGWRFFSYFLCGLSLVGIVAANARGAVLSAVLAIFVVWLRSPRKFMFLLWGAAGAVVVVIATAIIFPDGEFWKEIASISDGTEDSTGESRIVLWKMSWPIFLENPLLGAGAYNFGVVASQVIPFDPARPQFSSPERLYGITPHNIFVQVFAEGGLVGLACSAALLLAFFRQIHLLRSEKVARAWVYAHGPAWDPVNISKALEIAMICFLANGFFYNQLYIHWLWTLLALSSCFAALVPSAMRAARAKHEAAAMRAGHTGTDSAPARSPDSSVEGTPGPGKTEVDRDQNGSGSSSLGSGLLGH